VVGLETTGDDAFALTATVQNVDEIRAAVVSDLHLRTAGGDVRLAWRPAILVGAGPLDYEIHTADQMAVRPVAFRGLLPDPVGVPELRALRHRRVSPGPIRYLSPYRKRPGRQHRLPLGTPRALGSLGEGVSGILAHDQVRGGGELIRIVNEMLARIVPGWQILEVPAGPLWSTVLSRGDGARVRVNLADAGSGLAQVLPILVQCALDEIVGRVGPAPLQIIEEPEMHLHPAAHAELADLYLTTARLTDTRFLVETHSETLLLRLRRRIAAGDVPADMVAIYVVEQTDGVSTVRRVDIDDMGNLSGWPDGYFSQDYVEARALAEAQLKRGGHAA
jgi:hypothetical protein